MNREISRRALLIGAAATAMTLATPLVVSRAVDFEYKRKKKEIPRLKDVIEPASMSLGIAPDKNKIELSSMFSEVNLFQDYYRPWYTSEVTQVLSNGQIPMFSIRPYGKRNFGYQDLKNDIDHLKVQTYGLKGIPQGYFRFEYEMNAPWFEHGSSAQSPEEFIEGWKLMTDIIKNTNENLQMVWCPNIDYPLDPYYPGDEYVDVMALDGYNKHSPLPYFKRHLHPDASFEELFGQDVAYLQRLSNKPIMIAELGIDQHHNSLPWIANALHTAAQYDQVQSVYLFAWNKGKGWSDMDEANWGHVITPELFELMHDIPYYNHQTL